MSLLFNMLSRLVMYGCESWTRKKAECWRIDDFELWCWRRLFRVPWIAKRSHRSILKEISPEYSSEGLMLKLKLQYFGTWCEELTHWKRPCCRERLKAGRAGDKRGWDGWMASSTQWTWVWANTRRWGRTRSLACCSPCGHKGLKMTTTTKHGLWKLPTVPCQRLYQWTYAANESMSPLHFGPATELSFNILIMPVYMNSRGRK